MGVTADILATYRAPRRAMRRLLAQPRREGRLLGYAVTACLVVFVGQWPRLAREAALTGVDLNVLLGGALFGWMFVMPLALYLLAGISHGLASLAGGRGDGHGARLALFWALLAAAPLWLAHGLVAGAAGPGPLLSAVGLVAMAGFLWFWAACLVEAERGGGAEA